MGKADESRQEAGFAGRVRPALRPKGAQPNGVRSQKPDEVKTVLLTSFDVWKSRHTSNASDDLLQALQLKDQMNEKVHLLRKLPVEFELAPETIIAAMERLQPDIVVCCGMAEKRKLLSIESNGKFKDEVIHTRIDVRQLVRGLPITRVSHNAGKFVCNHTYYSILNYIRTTQPTTDCIFAHVPVLTAENRDAILADFSAILDRLKSIPQASHSLDCSLLCD